MLGNLRIEYSYSDEFCKNGEVNLRFLAIETIEPACNQAGSIVFRSFQVWFVAYFALIPH